MEQSPWLAAATGFVIEISFAISLGPQNILLLTCGFRSEGGFITGSVCFACSAILLAASASGLSGMAVAAPALQQALKFAGLVFLLWLAIVALRHAVTGSSGGGGTLSGSRRPVLAALAVSTLNPLVYLETVFVTGTTALQFVGPNRFSFVAGAWLGILLRVCTLLFGARWVLPALQGRASAIGHTVVAAIMLGNAAQVLRGLM